MDLKKWSELQGISGREELVRSELLKACKEIGDKPEISVDRMGNLIVHRSGRLASQKCVMVCAHMDEVGLMVLGAEEDGMLRIRPIGEIDPRMLVSKRVKVGYGAEAIDGVIGAKAIHLQSAEDRKHVLSTDQLYIDIGAKDKAEANAKAPASTPVTFAQDYLYFGHERAVGKAMGSRACVSVLLELAETVKPVYDTDFVFTCRREVGSRGAMGASYRIMPDEALILDATAANDAGEMPETQKLCSVGKGVAIGLTDRGSLSDPLFVREICKIASANRILFQLRADGTGRHETASIQRTGNGVKTALLAIPVRNFHSPAETVSLEDVREQYRLVKALLEEETL